MVPSDDHNAIFRRLSPFRFAYWPFTIHRLRPRAHYHLLDRLRTTLGASSLVTSLSLLLAHSQAPWPAQTQLLRVVGNLCLDHGTLAKAPPTALSVKLTIRLIDENRTRMVEKGVPVLLVRLLDSVSLAIASPENQLDDDVLPTIKSGSGALLNLVVDCGTSLKDSHGYFPQYA
jgi:hypothetical protein